jgi:hypothetical protein
LRLTDEELLLLITKMYYELDLVPSNVDTFVDFDTLEYYLNKKINLHEIKIIDYKIEDENICYATMQNKENEIFLICPGTYSNGWEKVGSLGYSIGLEDAVEMLRYIKEEKLNNITTIGCGLGGNVAQFLAIKSSKVDYCVTIDSPGFSNEFFDRNLDLINDNKDKIHSYMTDGTIIGRLFWNLTEENEIWQSINEIGNISYFNIDKNSKLSLTKNLISEEDILKKLSGVLMNTLSTEEKVKIFDFVGKLLQHMFGHKGPDFSSRYTENEKDEFIHYEENEEMIAELLAYAQKIEEQEIKF